MTFIYVDGYSNSSDLNGPYTLTIEAPNRSPMYRFQNGDDGCGGSCGTCADGQVYGEAGLCRSAPAGDSCVDPEFWMEVPFLWRLPAIRRMRPMLTRPLRRVSGWRKSGARPTIGSTSSCSTRCGNYVITLDASFDSTVCLFGLRGFQYLSRCGRHPQYRNARTDLGADETGFICVDGWSNGSNLNGTFDLTIDKLCTPNCDGKTCGDDGCGGVCGVCADGESCSDVVCEEDVVLIDVGGLLLEQANSTKSFSIPAGTRPRGRLSRRRTGRGPGFFRHGIRDHSGADVVT